MDDLIGLRSKQAIAQLSYCVTPTYISALVLEEDVCDLNSK